jgi:hypothetical protein
MASKKGSSKNQQNHYKVYQSDQRAIKNRTRRLAKHIKKFPDDEQAKNALKKGLKYRRRAPIAAKKVWNADKIFMAQYFRKVGSHGHRALEKVHIPMLWSA